MTEDEKLVAALRDGIAVRSMETADGLMPDLGVTVQLMQEAASAISRLSTEVQELRAALRPFAEHDVGVVNDTVFTIPDEHPLLGNGLGNDWRPTVTVGDFRRARAALKAEPVEP